MKDKAKLLELSPAQLKGKLEELVEEGRNLRFAKVVSSVDNPSKFRYVRRNIARIKTLLKEYELGLSVWQDKRIRNKNVKTK